jgi:protein O-mannosyl-transferase
MGYFKRKMSKNSFFFLFPSRGFFNDYSPKTKANTLIFFISLLGALLYLPTTSFEFTADDGLFTLSNLKTREGLAQWPDLFKKGSMAYIEQGGTNSGIYRPLTLFTFALERELAGEFDPVVGHSYNLVLYFLLLFVVGKLLVFLFALKNLPFWVPLLILLLYALHPIHTEVVASVKSRDVLMSSFFAFSGIYVWAREKGQLSTRKWIFVLVLYFLSLISKEESIPLMIMGFLLGWYFFGFDFQKSLKNMYPFFIPFGIYMVIRSWLLDSNSGAGYENVVNSIMYRASGSDWIATNFFVYIQYVKLLFFPHPLSWDYSYGQIQVQSFSNPVVWISVCIFGAMVYFALKGLKKRSLFSFGIVFYLATFSIFANLTPSLVIGSNLGERFMFIPSLAFVFLIVMGLYHLIQAKFPNKSFYLVSGIILPIGILYSWKTIDRIPDWKDNIALFGSGVESSPRSWRTHISYADALRFKAHELKETNEDSAKIVFEKSSKHFKRGIEILGPKNDVPQYYSNYTEVLLNLGDTTEAEAVLRMVTKDHPKMFFAWFKLGGLEFSRRNYEEAKKLYLQSLKTKDPDIYSAYKNLGNTYFNLSEFPEAMKAFELAKAQKEDPELEVILANYRELGTVAFKPGTMMVLAMNEEEKLLLSSFQQGNLNFKNGQYKEAVGHYRKIETEFEKIGGAKKYPSYYPAYGKALIETKDTLEAKKKFLKAYEDDPKNALVLTNLGVIALLKDKNYSEAEKYFRAAIQNNPEDPFSSRVNLGTTLILSKKEKEAIQILEDALKYGSSQAVVRNLYLLNTSIGNVERAAFYKELINQPQ